MKTILILFSILPIIAFSAVVPLYYADQHSLAKRNTNPTKDDSKIDPNKVVEEVQERVDDFMRSFFMITSVAVDKRPKDIEKISNDARNELEALKNKNITEEAKKKVREIFEKAQDQILNDTSTIVNLFQTVSLELVTKIDELKEHARRAYGDLDSKVSKPLDDVHKKLENFLNIAQIGFVSAEK